jgi:crossover junction endodeoxyribonuclease RuvC
MERLANIRDGIMLVVAAQDDPIVVVEGYSFSSRNSQSHALGELGGVVRLALYEAGVAYIDVPPTSRAKFATGKGNASKNEVVSSISARTGIVWSGKGADDMCDAWVLRQMGLARLGESEYDWPVANMTALDKIDWSGFPSA